MKTTEQPNEFLEILQKSTGREIIYGVPGMGDPIEETFKKSHKLALETGKLVLLTFQSLYILLGEKTDVTVTLAAFWALRSYESYHPTIILIEEVPDPKTVIYMETWYKDSYRYRNHYTWTNS